MNLPNQRWSLRVPLCVPLGFIVLIGVMSMATICVALLIPAPWGVRMPACIAIAFAMWRTLAVRFHGGLQYGFMYVICDTEQNWWLERTNGDRMAATLREDSVVNRRLVVLNLRADLPRRDFSFLLWGQQCGYQMFRRLRVRLLLHPRSVTTNCNWPPAG